MNLTICFSESELAIISKLSAVKRDRFLRAFKAKNRGEMIDLKGDLAIVFELLYERYVCRQDEISDDEISIEDAKKEKQEKEKEETKESFPPHPLIKKENNKKKEEIKERSCKKKTLKSRKKFYPKSPKEILSLQNLDPSEKSLEKRVPRCRSSPTKLELVV